MFTLRIYLIALFQTAPDKGRNAAAQRQDTSSEDWEPGWLHFDIFRSLESDHHDSLRKRAESSHRDRGTGVALSLCRIYLSCKNAFPTPEVIAWWEKAVRREACAKTGTNPESFILFEIVSLIPPKWRCISYHFFQFAEGNIKLFIEAKKRVTHIIEAQYGFDTSPRPYIIGRNASIAQGLLTNMAFIYPVCPSPLLFNTR